MIMNVNPLRNGNFEIVDGGRGLVIGYIEHETKHEKVDDTYWVAYKAFLIYDSENFYSGYCFKEALEWLEFHFDKEKINEGDC